MLWLMPLHMPSSWFVTSAIDNVIYKRYIIPKVRVSNCSKVSFFLRDNNSHLLDSL